MIIRSFVILCTVVIAVSASAQEKEQFTNLQVLPAHIEKDTLISVMRGFSRSLGVRCDYCHVENERGAEERHDFASDDKPEKQTAREMMRMVAAINGDFMSKLKGGDTDDMKVACITCHRGFAHPEAIEDILSGAYQSGGLDTALARFAELREEYYGSSAFDFRERTLNSFAADIAEAGHDQDALAVLDANAVYFPESTDIPLLKSRIYMQMGKIEEAKALIEKVLVVDPDNRYAKRLLQSLMAPPPEEH